MDKSKILKSLNEAIQYKSPELIECVVTNIHKYGYDPCFTIPLIKLLKLDCHYKHEDIVLVLQSLKDDRATETLLATAKLKFDYLDYDDSYPLVRKCTWALADIHTENSKKALQELTKTNDPIIAKYALKRLENWV